MTDPKNDDASLGASAQVQVTALSSTMFYTAGRIDAADRRAGSTIALALGLLGLSLGTGRIDVSLTGMSLLGEVINNVSSLLAFVALVFALLGIWARVASSDDWISMNFLGKYDVETVARKMGESDSSVTLGMLTAQRGLSALVRRKNLYSNLAIATLVLATSMYVVGI